MNNPMTDIFTAVTSAITQVITWTSTWLNAITDNAILTFFVLALPLLTIGLTILFRMLHKRA